MRLRVACLTVVFGVFLVIRGGFLGGIFTRLVNGLRRLFGCFLGRLLDLRLCRRLGLGIFLEEDGLILYALLGRLFTADLLNDINICVRRRLVGLNDGRRRLYPLRGDNRLDLNIFAASAVL